MKTKNVIALLLTVLSAGSSGFAQVAESPSNILSMFSTTEYLLMGLCSLLLAVIWVLATNLKSVLEQLR